MPTASIVSVKSDHIDPAQLDTTSPGSTSPTVSIYTIKGQANIDPLTMAPGAAITETTALSIPAVFSAVRFFGGTIGGLPKFVHQKHTRLEGHALEWTLNHEVSELNTPFTFFSTFIGHAVLWGNGYAAIRRQGSDTRLFNLPPDRMKPFRWNGRVVRL